MAARGKKLSDAYVELGVDDSKLGSQVKVKAQRVGKEFGGSLNKTLRQLSIDPVNIKASPADALKAIDRVDGELRDLSRDASTLEVRMRAEKGLADLARFRKQVGAVDASIPVKPEVKPGAVPKLGADLNQALVLLDVEPVPIDADPRTAMRAIEETEERLQALSRQATTVELRVQTENALGQLGRFRKQLGDIGPEAASGFFAKFSGRLGPLIASMPISGPMAIALGSAAVVAAPVIGSAIAGAIIGGVGIGGVAGGLLVASRDTRVKAAADEIKDQLMRRLQLASGVFVGPAIQAAKDIRSALADVDIESIFRNASRYVQPLVDGTTSAIRDVGAAVQGLVANAGPAIRAISVGIANIGESLGRGLASLSDNGEEAAAALGLVFGLISSSIDAVFLVVNGLTEMYGVVRKLGLDQGLQVFLKLTGNSMDETAKSASGTSKATQDLGFKMDETAAKAKIQKEAQQGLTAAQKNLTLAQTDLKNSLDAMAPSAGRAATLVDALRTASQNMYGAAIAGSEANEQYEASWDDLSESVKANKRSLDVHTTAGRSNRDSLQALLTSSNELYFSNIAAGQSTDSARKKHEARTESIRKESVRLGLNKKQTEALIKTYGQIPPDKTTNLILDGLKEIRHALEEVYLAQRALAEGKTIKQIRGGYQGDPKLFKAEGGNVPGHSPHPRADNIPAMLTADEWVIRQQSARRMEREHPGALAHINRHGTLPAGYADGGMVAPVDVSRRWPFRTNISNAYVMSRIEALKRVTPVFSGDWPSSPAAQRGDSGVWRKVVALIKSGPNQGSFGNAYRPGDPKWHGSGRAVDWMGFNMDALASFLASKRPLELIHRTRRRDYAYTRGVNKGSFSRGLMEAHRNHIHIAMAEGGQVPVRQVAMADTGRATLKPGWNLIGNGTGADEHLSTVSEQGNATLSQIAGLMAAQNDLMRQMVSLTAANPAAFAGAMNRTGSGLLQQARRW